MSSELAITADELVIVKRILSRILPPGYQTYVFGSRATGVRLKRWSDLDLAIAGPGPLPSGVLSELKYAFDEAPLLWKVDLLDLATVSETFGRIVDESKVLLA